MKFKISIIIKFFFISCECVRIKYSNQSKFKLELKKLQCKFENSEVQGFTKILK